MTEQQHIVKEIKTIDQFKTIIADSTENPSLVVVDFFSDWCPPCKMIAPYIDELAKIYTNVSFYKINTGTAELKIICDACEIRSIPTFCYFYGGTYFSKVIGADKNKIEEHIKKYENGEKNEK